MVVVQILPVIVAVVVVVAIAAAVAVAIAIITLIGLLIVPSLQRGEVGEGSALR